MTENDEQLRMNLAELAERSGVPPRTIRFYIARGLLMGPRKRGRAAAYGQEHLNRLKEIRMLQDTGRTLHEISQLFPATERKPEAPRPLPAGDTWTHYEVASGVLVLARGGVPPWRARRIREAVGRMAAELSGTEQGGHEVTWQRRAEAMSGDEAFGGFVPTNAHTGQPCRLVMQSLRLVGRVLPVGARLFVRHVFRSGESGPIEVVYAFALPRDAALRRFKVVGDGFSVRSELRPTEEARTAYEQGLDQGHLSVLARQYGDGYVNLTVGNVRPGETVVVQLEIVAGVEVRDDGFRFRFPFTLAPAYHPKARPVEVAPGQGEIELPVEDFDDLVLPTWKAKADGLHEVDLSLSVWSPAGICEVSSPSHALRVQTENHSLARVRLATKGDVPDRDLVLDVRHGSTDPLVIAGTDAKGAGRFAVMLPSAVFGQAPVAARRVVFVVDRSGSMQGAPMQQALAAVAACLGALSDQDWFGLVCFDNTTEIAAPSLLAGDRRGRDTAAAFLRRIGAQGGTELAAGLSAAAAMLSGGGDILLFTDGQVMGTEAIISQAKAAGIRIHCLGIGSASQDRFLASLARETGGVSRMVTPRERVDMAAMELFAAVGRPVACKVRVETAGLPGARIEPDPLDVVFAETPLVVFGSTEGPATGQLVVSFKAGSEVRSVTVPMTVAAGEYGEMLGLLQGARLITSMDSECGAAAADDAAEERRQSSIRETLEQLSRRFGLASRQMSLVAVVERRGDRPGVLPQTHVVPVGMPQDVQFLAYFGHGTHSAKLSFAYLDGLERSQMGHFVTRCFQSGAAKYFDVFKSIRSEAWLSPPAAQPPRDRTEETLLEVAQRIEPDGGMPGQTQEERILASLLAVLLFAKEGHTATAGAFMPHMQRLLSFLDAADLSSFTEDQRALLSEVRRQLAAGSSPPGPWDKLTRSYLSERRVDSARFWDKLQAGARR